jgi:hypothetical protein
MLCREIIAVCSQIHTKHIYTLCGQNMEFCVLNGTYSNHWALRNNSAVSTANEAETAVANGAYRWDKLDCCSYEETAKNH